MILTPKQENKSYNDLRNLKWKNFLGHTKQPINI